MYAKMAADQQADKITEGKAPMQVGWEREDGNISRFSFKFWCDAS